MESVERLTKRTEDGILAKEDYGEEVLKTLYSCYGGKPNPHYTNCEEGYCAIEKLAEYEDAEEQGLLLRLPCGIGADVYSIPSKTNFLLNLLNRHEGENRVFHQTVERITNKKGGWYMECDSDLKYGTGRILLDTSYGVTWFLSREEAEAKLKEMEESYE